MHDCCFLQDCYPQDHPTAKQLLAQRKIVLQSVEILDSCPIREIIISSFLKIVNVTESDAGVYICSAQHTVLIPSPHVEMSHWNVTAITGACICRTFVATVDAVASFEYFSMK